MSEGSSLGLHVANIAKCNRAVRVCLRHFNIRFQTSEHSQLLKAWHAVCWAFVTGFSPWERFYCRNPSASISRGCRLHLSSASLKSCAESYHFSLGNWDAQCLSQQQPYPEIWSGDITQFHLLLPLVLISLWNNRCTPSLSALYGGWAVRWNPIAIECSQSGVSSLMDWFLFGYKYCIITLFQTVINSFISVSKHHTSDFSTVTLILFKY